MWSSISFWLLVLAAGAAGCAPAGPLQVVAVDSPGTPLAQAALTTVMTRAEFQDFAKRFPDLCRPGAFPFCAVTADFAPLRSGGIAVSERLAVYLLPSGLVCRVSIPFSRRDEKTVDVGRGIAQIPTRTGLGGLLLDPVPGQDLSERGLEACRALPDSGLFHPATGDAASGEAAALRRTSG